MIDLHYWPTPNGHKITLFLEEAVVDYTIRPVDIGKGAQFAPDYLAIAPNNRMPAIVDHAPRDAGAPVSIFESGAILLYLAHKEGRFGGEDPRAHVRVLEWLMWQMGGLGPMLGQYHHFALYAPEKLPYAIDRYRKEAARLYGVLDRRLATSEWVAGDSYTVADMACFPWLLFARQEQDPTDFPHVARWHDAIAARPATARAYARARDVRPGEQTERDWAEKVDARYT